MREQFYRVPYNHLIKKLNICNIPLSESEESESFTVPNNFQSYKLQKKIQLFKKIKNQRKVKIKKIKT